MTTQITEHTSSTTHPWGMTHQQHPHFNPNPQPSVTYQVPIAASWQDMIDILMNEIHHLALEQIVNSEFITLNGDTLTLGPNTPNPIVFNRNPDGSITTLKPNETSLIATEKAFDIFRHTWDEIEHRCRKNVENLLQARFPLQSKACQDHEWYINREARRVLANAGYGYFRSPSALGYSKLHQFLGKSQVIRALKFAGSKATLAHFNLIQKNPEAFTQAHEMNPNATVMFLNQIANLRHQPLWDFRNDLTPKEIIGEARKHYPTAPHLWDTFSKLNQRAINHYPPHNRGSHDRGQMYLIAELALESQINPTYSAIKTLSKYGPAIDQLPRDFISAFFRESHHRARNRKTGRTQAQLIREFREAKLRVLCRRNPVATPQTQLTWPEWMQLLDTTQPLYKDIQPKKKPRKYSKASPELKTQKASQDQRLDRIIEQLDMVEITQGSLALESVEGQSVTLRSDFNPVPTSPPLLQITRLPSGEIDIRSYEYWTQDIVLPTPTDRPEPSGHKSQYHSPKINQCWTTHGLVTKITRHKAMRAIKATWTETTPQSPKPPSEARITAALNRFWASQSKELRPWTTDQKLSKSLHEAIATLVDPDTWDFINQRGMDVTRERYNMARTDPNIIQSLQKTNPGVLEWAYTHGSPTQEIRHPGQIINAARESMTEHGVDMRHWRTISQIPTETMRDIVNAHYPGQGVLFMNISARAGIEPDPKMLSDSRNYYLTFIHPLDRTSALARQNHDTVLEIMYREHAKHSPAHQQWLALAAQDILDYSRAMTSMGKTINSRSHQGLMKKARIWHRQISRRRTINDWLQILDNGNNHYRAWKSAISQPIKQGEYTVTPLTSEMDLYHESLRMNHCVIGYGNPCTSNASRIFSVSKNGETVATSEIRFSDDGWKPVQTRGPHNHPVEQEIIDLMKQVAQGYTQEYQQDPEHWAETWWTQYKPETEEDPKLRDLEREQREILQVTRD